jgi:ABC-type Fe3+-hydroxamate transport system substrate-binding protein
MLSLTDQLNRTIVLRATPARIVSIVPSQTELLYYLGLEQEVVGITKFCVHPTSWFSSKTRVGGTKAIKMDIIHQLQPDLVLANKEENVREQVEEIARHYPTWISDVNNLEDALAMIKQVGAITGKTEKAGELVAGINVSFSQLTTDHSQPGTAYLIWKNPYMTIGGDTFIHNMLTRCGFHNIFGNTTRYPEVTVEQLQAADCRLLLLSSEPFPFQQKHIAELQEQLPHTKILLADGEFFSWYGSRLLEAPRYFQQLISELSKGLLPE